MKSQSSFRLIGTNLVAGEMVRFGMPTSSQLLSGRPALDEIEDHLSKHTEFFRSHSVSGKKQWELNRDALNGEKERTKRPKMDTISIAQETSEIPPRKDVQKKRKLIKKFKRGSCQNRRRGRAKKPKQNDRISKSAGEESLIAETRYNAVESSESTKTEQINPCKRKPEVPFIL